MNIYIGEPKIITLFDTQGPCPDGFHIPTKDDGQGLINIYSGLGLTGNENFRTYFKIPLTCCRSRSNGNMDKTNPPMLWTSTSYDNDNGYYILMNSYNSSLAKIDKYYKSVGACIRPFKNKSVSPDNSWTTIYDGSSVATNAGIFWSSTLGLISASSDGINWMTIADKNVGATDVYNGTTSSATTGYYFQRGNNYGFPGWSTTSVSKTSSTQVDATNYGPGNYYNSDTFITRSSSPYNRDSSNNDNLRGGVTQGTSTKQPQELQNIYIGEYGWKPDANTIAYFPFINDKSNAIVDSNISISNSNIGITTLGGVKCLQLDGQSTQTLNIGFTVANITSVMCWVNSWNDFGYLISERSTSGGDQSRGLWLSYNQMHVNRYPSTDLNYNYNFDSNWHCIGFTEDSSGAKLFLDDNVTPVATASNINTFNILTNNVGIFCNNNNGTLENPGKGYASKLVLMNAPITIDDFLDFYNQTKSNYGL